jgi:hypothetical protein
MGKIGYGYGSEWQLMWYLARHRADLSRAVASESGLDDVAWQDFPQANAERCDSEWKGVGFLRSNEIEAEWSKRWPSRGNPPNWDAVGRGLLHGKSCWLLVEAKAHTAEVRSDCSAVEQGGLDLIQRTLHSTKVTLSVNLDRDWLRGYYQHCNRLAVLQFLRETGVPAKLIFLYFYGDRAQGRACPRSPDEWSTALAEQDQHVGVPADSSIRSDIHKVFLPAFTNLHD